VTTAIGGSDGTRVSHSQLEDAAANTAAMARLLIEPILPAVAWTVKASPSSVDSIARWGMLR